MPKTLGIQNYKSLAKDFDIKPSKILEMKCLECQTKLKDLFASTEIKLWGHKGVYFFFEKDLLDTIYSEQEEIEASTILVEEGYYSWEGDYRYYIICRSCLKNRFYEQAMDFDYELICYEEDCEGYNELSSCKHTICDPDAWSDDPKAEEIYYENLNSLIDLDLTDFIYDHGIALTDSESYASWWQQY